MVNPILAMLQQPKAGKGGSVMDTLSMVKNLMGGGNPDQVFRSEMQRNPKFAKFVQENQNLSVDELASKAGIDPAMINMLFK